MTRLLSDVAFQYGGDYRFTLTRDLLVDLGKDLWGCHVLTNDGCEWAVLKDDLLRIRAGYAFDGCSPAYRFLGRWHGAPAPRSAVAASAVHDVLRGFIGVPCLHYSRKDADDIFRDILASQGFRMSGVYHGAVASILGSIYMRWKGSRQDSPSCLCHPCLKSLSSPNPWSGSLILKS